MVARAAMGAERQPGRRAAFGCGPVRRPARTRTRGLAGGCATAAVTAVVAVALTACGSDGSGGDGSDSDPAATADARQSPAGTAAADGGGGAPHSGAAGTRIMPAAAMTGDCFVELPAVDHSMVQQVELADCADPHAVEIVDDFTIDEPQAGFEHVEPIATEQCTTRARDAVDLRRVDPQMTVFYWGPVPETWEQGDRGVICGVGLTDGKSSGSVLKDGS